MNLEVEKYPGELHHLRHKVDLQGKTIDALTDRVVKLLTKLMTIHNISCSLLKRSNPG